MMVSVFEAIRNREMTIVAAISLISGTLEIGVCSWALHRLIMDEQFLIYILGHAMYKKTKNVQEAMAHYHSVREYLRNDFFEVLVFMKIALSVSLVGGAILVMASFMSFRLNDKRYGRRLWIILGSLSLSGLISGFALVMKFLVKNVVYLQAFLATTGANIFLIFHILLSLIIMELISISNANKSQEDARSGSHTPNTDVTNAGSQTPSITVSIQEEFPLPSPPSTHSQGTPNGNANTGARHSTSDIVMKPETPSQMPQRK